MKTKLINHFNTFALMASVLVMLLSFPVDSYANSTTEKNNLATITGTVTDAVNGEALIGVTVQVKGSSTATMTDVEGKYQIEAQPSDFLVFTYTGMETQEIGVNTQGVINIQLAENAELVDEVVVIGYGKQKKSLLTGSISKVTNKNLDEIPISRVDDALAGQVAGVNIQMTNPAAGEAPTIRVRGQGSISFGSAPLIVVDGIVVGNDADFLSSIDMNDVSSVEVLKDAASSAIYGSRGANGIIMITTKGGKEGPVQLDYNTYVGFKSVPKTDVLTTVDSWAQFVRDNNDGELTDRMKYIEQLGTTTDWEDVMMDGGIIQSHALSARGGTKRTKFRASASYLNDEGVLLTDNYEKVNFRLNVDTKINDRLSFGTMLNPSYTEQRRFPIGVHDALRQNPWLPVFLDENSIQYVNRVRENGRWADAQIGDYAMERMFDDYDLVTGQSGLTGTDISATSNQSAYAKVVERDRRRMQTKVYSNTYMNLKLAKGLTFKQTLGGDYRYTRNSTWVGVEASRNGAGDSESSLSTASRYHLVSESTLNFNRKFGEHTIDAVGGYAYESWNTEFTALEAAGFDNDLIQTIPAANLVGASTSRSAQALISYLSRVNYTYGDKYLLSLSARWDGSSKFGPDNKYGFFPSAAVGWRISEEGFLKDSEVIEELKARFSYGVSGSNSGIGEYDYIGLISPVGTGIAGVGTAFNPTNISNSALRWEKLLEYNAGIDVSVLNGRLAMSLDLYNRTSSDLLLELPIPSITGFDNALVNKGIVENKGFELEIRTNNITKENFTWSSSVLVTRNVNTLVDFAGASGLVTFVDSKRPALWIAEEGQPISSFYGYVVKEEIDAQYIKNPFYPINGQSQDIYVKDLNGDGLIDTDDRTILGSPYPDVIWSINNTIRYNEFDLSFMFQGSHGAEVRNISSQYINNEFSSNQDSDTDLPNADQTVQRIFTNDDIQDASYVALRNLNLGYTLPKSLMSKAGIRKLRVYVSTQNLFYIMSEGYTGYNPEGIDQGLDSPLTYGYQRGPAPIYRTVSFGLNISL
jgi:TonB-linked SusC/RagA family outer membrane protein